ncbi:hypothetical protein Mal15_49150 [Stieleria maiorica]|uniref:Uncharacterized protein n=1 Tax=Stieleria maiorica TaxID=2795974 RepID=A0A5B9MI64_9BACT|nr:hypothetical protein Mal15_49150 [Stieleria maiorica]
MFVATGGCRATVSRLARADATCLRCLLADPCRRTIGIQCAQSGYASVEVSVRSIKPPLCWPQRLSGSRKNVERAFILWQSLVDKHDGASPVCRALIPTI